MGRPAARTRPFSTAPIKRRRPANPGHYYCSLFVAPHSRIMVTGDLSKLNKEELAFYGDTDFYHAERRKAIIKKHPQLRSLMQKPDPSFKFVLMACMVTHVFIAYCLRDAPLPVVILTGLLLGIFYSCPISNSLHEIVHELAFERKPGVNDFFGLMVNLPLVWPLYGAYHKSHRNHHTYLGTELDIKYPNMDEALEHDQNFFTRFWFLIMHPIHSTHRWSMTRDNKATPLVFWNVLTITLFNALIFGFMGYKSFLYLLISFWLNECILIEGSKTFTDHWSDEKTSHTNSYYGPVNRINFNIGHHREHHDFPNIAGRYLSVVKETAPEFYEDPAFIETKYFGAVWKLLSAAPNQGLTRFANKIPVKEKS